MRKEDVVGYFEVLSHNISGGT